MNLNKYAKRAIVNSIIEDVPQIDYDEKIKKIALEDRLPKIHPSLVTIWLNNELRGYIAVDYDGEIGQHVPFWDVPLSKSALEQIEALRDSDRVQNAQLYELRKKVTAMIEPIRTTQQFEKNLPDFTAYLPVDAKTPNVYPLVVANTVADLSKLGWPKNAKVA